MFKQEPCRGVVMLQDPAGALGGLQHLEIPFVLPLDRSSHTLDNLV